MSKLDNLKNKLRNLKQNSNLSEAEIDKIATEQSEKEDIMDSLTFCLPEEKKLASKKLEEYLEQGQIETTSDKSTLMLLIDNEIAIERIKKIITKNFDKENPYIPVELAKEKNDLISQNLTLKDKLGLNKKAGEENSVVKTIEDLKSRFKKWINQPENRSNYTFACFHCGKTFLIRRRIDKDKDEVREHPWYINGSILMNKQMFIDYEKGVLSIEQMSRYLDCSPDYILWLKQNYPINEDIE